MNSLTHSFLNADNDIQHNNDNNGYKFNIFVEPNEEGSCLDTFVGFPQSQHGTRRDNNNEN